MLILQLQVQTLQLISDKISQLLPVSERHPTVKRQITITFCVEEANDFPQRCIVSDTHLSHTSLSQIPFEEITAESKIPF